LLSLFRTAIKISTDSENKKEQEKSEVKKTDKLTEIILSSNSQLYKDLLKVSVEKLPKMILKCLKSEIDIEDVSEKNYEHIKTVFGSTKKTMTIMMRSFISNYIKLLKGGSEAQSIEMFLVSLLDCAKL